MRIRFYIDPDTGLPHIAAHDVDEAEAADVVRKPLEEIAGRAGSVIAVGRRAQADTCASFSRRMTTARVSLSSPHTICRPSN
jgi:hypothetical protein